MPFIDLSFVTLDPSIAGIPFVVYRRSEEIDDDGRVTTETTPYDAIGGVFPTGSNQLVRDPDRDFSDRGITIITRFRLQLESDGFKPDLVEWPKDSGNLYLVNHINDFSQYGDGFMEAQAVAFQPVHLTPPE